MMDYYLKTVLLVVCFLEISFSPFTLTTSETCPLSCKCSSENVLYEVICPTFIPRRLPFNTHFVEVANIINKDTIKQQDFSSKSWASVKELRLSSSPDIEEIEANAFSNLSGLLHLHIHFTYLKKLSPFAFSDLLNLRLLNMSGNGGLNITELVIAISINNSLQNLQELILVDLNRNIQAEKTDSSLFTSLADKPVRHLDLTGAYFTVQDIRSFIYAFRDTIQVLNVSHAFIVGDIITRLNYNQFPILEIIDISYAHIPSVQRAAGVGLFLAFIDCSLPFVLSNQLKLNAILESKESVRFTSKTYASGTCKRQIRKRIELRNNNLVWLNGSYSPKLPTYQEVDISNNGLMYLGTNTSSHFSEIIWANLSANKLSHMEQYPEFETLLQKNVLLEWLDLSANGLTNIPRNVFQNNNKLKTLILANNKLHGIFFEIKHLQHLELLDLSKNLIAFFDNSARSSFESLSNSNTGENSTVKFNVQFKDNELLCSCETVDFVRWFVTTDVMIKNRDVYTCSLNKEVVLIDTNTLKESEYQCEKMKIIIMAVCTSLACLGIFALAIGLGRYVYQQRRKMARIRRLVNKYRVANPPNKYLLFLSFCSKDDDFVSQHVTNELRHRLQERLPNGKNLVCIGDQEFEFGRLIIEEIIKCIEASSVTMFIISKAFCESNYCEYETIVAQLDRKPVVLMFLEEVDPMKLPKVLHKHFSQFVRARWIPNEDGWILKPDWNKVCDSILELAGKSL